MLRLSDTKLDAIVESATGIKGAVLPYHFNSYRLSDSEATEIECETNTSIKDLTNNFFKKSVSLNLNKFLTYNSNGDEIPTIEEGSKYEISPNGNVSLIIKIGFLNDQDFSFFKRFIFMKMHDIKHGEIEIRIPDDASYRKMAYDLKQDLADYERDKSDLSSTIIWNTGNITTYPHIRNFGIQKTGNTWKYHP